MILWMHTDQFRVDFRTIKELKNLTSKPVMGYWDGDLYQSPFRPLPNELLELSCACDVVFAQGFGKMTEIMKSKGCNDIRFVPAFGDDKRFYPFQLKNKKDYDIVMIGNNITSRNPFKITMAGTRFRKEIVEKFSKKFMNKFAVFGNNWKVDSAKGPVPYTAQHKIYSRSRIALSVNNYSGQYYFSDRLPIAMLSGIPIVHNYEKNIEKLFEKCDGVKFFKSLEDAFKQCQEFL